MNKPEPISPLSSSGRTPDPDGSIPVCIRRWDEKLQQVVFAPLPAASPEGSAGLDASLWHLALLRAVNDWTWYAKKADVKDDQPTWEHIKQLELLDAAIPGLIDAAKELKALKAHESVTDLEIDMAREVVEVRAQLTDARSRIAELEEKNAQLRELINGVHETNRGMQEGRKRLATTEMLVRNERDALRRSREQAIAAIEVLPRYRPGDERESGMVSTQSGLWLHRSAVLAILRGAE